MIAVTVLLNAYHLIWFVLAQYKQQRQKSAIEATDSMNSFKSSRLFSQKDKVVLLNV
jgi:hypothetical protein